MEVARLARLLEAFGFKERVELTFALRVVQGSPAPVHWQLAEFIPKTDEIVRRPVARPQLIYFESTVYNCLRQADYVLYAWKSLFLWAAAIRGMVITPSYEFTRVIMPACFSCASLTGSWCEDCDCRDGVPDQRVPWCWRPLCSTCDEDALLCCSCQEMGSELTSIFGNA